MPVSFSQNGHTFDVVISSKGLRVEHGGAEVFRYWPGDEYSANLPTTEHVVTPETVEQAATDAQDGDTLVLGPGQYQADLGGNKDLRIRAPSGTITINVD